MPEHTMDVLASNLTELLDASSGATVTFKAKDLQQRLTGRFYTHERIGRAIARDIASRLPDRSSSLKVIDPFCGDGRLIRWLLEEMQSIGRLPVKQLQVSIWDCDESAVKNAVETVRSLELPIALSVDARVVDSFVESMQLPEAYDACITNPPWETLKPDARELASLDELAKEKYVSLLKNKIFRLNHAFPHSKAARSFSGWGANLARYGIEASVRLVRENAAFGIVAPATIFGDQISAPLRAWLFTSNRIDAINHYPAEARLFEEVDQSAVYFVGERKAQPSDQLEVIQHPAQSSAAASPTFALSADFLQSHDFAIGFNGSSKLSDAISHLLTKPRLIDFENGREQLVRVCRELDETGIALKLCDTGEYQFVKGRQIKQYSYDSSVPTFLKAHIAAPATANEWRVVWRDVARQSSARRMIATLVPPGTVTGNSVNVLCAKGNAVLLKAFVAIFNSTIFEAQVRASISTNHLSAGAIRKLRVPDLNDDTACRHIAGLVDTFLASPSISRMAEIDVAIARWYDLPLEIFESLLEESEQRAPETVAAVREILRFNAAQMTQSTQGIPNHFASKLSELDLQICRAVPPGGNWKDIPEEVPSQRIANIRLSFARGEGSRSTYYGRLHPDRPSYTVNTYFSRPGNGCHIHYDIQNAQHRTISQREAARLQSFPDSFEFLGSKTSVATQIGNAVPPLLAFQIARHIGFTGQTVDLFAGAGGLGLGFKWAGWTTLVANELEPNFAATYVHNVHHDIVVGDVRDPGNKKQLLETAKAVRDPSLPLCILGGPPCQGFSTAGNKRSMDDDRNWLFRDYCDLLAKLKPDVFVFENVTGLLNMEGGRVFEMVREQLSKHAKRLTVWRLNTENYGIPQRRSRVIIIGDNTGKVPTEPPATVTSLASEDLFGNLPPTPSVRDALDDLPRLTPGLDGSGMPYRGAALTAYQRFMRGEVDAAHYLSTFTP